ncbi:hypothetical protein [Trichocoleus desertorum]|uniref:hypothetical protein n=1 Tax=Trichocoleus desertorum TaxID=1481672 RepID=UPI003296BA29
MGLENDLKINSVVMEAEVAVDAKGSRCAIASLPLRRNSNASHGMFLIQVQQLFEWYSERFFLPIPM